MPGIDQGRVHPQQQRRVAGLVGRPVTGSVPRTCSWIRRTRAAARSAAARSPKLTVVRYADVAASLPTGSWRQSLCWSTPAMASGCSACIISARRPATGVPRSVLTRQVTLAGPKNPRRPGSPAPRTRRPPPSGRPGPRPPRTILPSLPWPRPGIAGTTEPHTSQTTHPWQRRPPRLPCAGRTPEWQPAAAAPVQSCAPAPPPSASRFTAFTARPMPPGVWPAPARFGAADSSARRSAPTTLVAAKPLFPGYHNACTCG